MKVYRCDECQKLSQESPFQVSVVSDAWVVSETRRTYEKVVYLCAACVNEICERDAASGGGRWTNNGYTWTSASGTSVDVQQFSTKRFPRKTDGSED